LPTFGIVGLAIVIVCIRINNPPEQPRADQQSRKRMFLQFGCNGASDAF
jgi:hypothetical protein